jgi:hypothetical protein
MLPVGSDTNSISMISHKLTVEAVMVNYGG